MNKLKKNYQSMGCGIYMIKSEVDNKVYIGSSINLKNRKYKHYWMLRRNKHDNKHLQNSFNKFGESNFIFETLEECDLSVLVDRENHYIELYKSNDSTHGFNLAVVNNFRRNTFNNEVKKNLSKHYLIKNSNFKSFSLENIETNEVTHYDNLVEAANFLIDNSFTSGSPKNVRQKLSYCLRNKKVNNGKNSNGSVRKICYKHKLKIIN